MEKKSDPTYGLIIDPQTYTRLIERHRYIGAADEAIIKAVGWRLGRILAKKEQKSERVRVVDVGTGPARLLLPLSNMLEKNFHGLVETTGMDHDRSFIEHGLTLLQEAHRWEVKILEVDLTGPEDLPVSEVDIFVSQGLHHHIPKGKPIQTYLRKLRDSLANDGVMYIGDEFLPGYEDEEERRLRAVVWYSHIIASALRAASGKQRLNPDDAALYELLAVEEIKTLLDDILGEGYVKQPKQLQAVRESVQAINQAVRLNNSAEAERLGGQLLQKIDRLSDTKTHGDRTIDLSRGDRKISLKQFMKEMKEAGFAVTNVQSFGPILTVGAMCVCKAQRTA